MVYGPAFGDTTNGYVMYEGGHDLDKNGTTAEKVAAQRCFFNFALLAGKNKQLDISNVQTPATMYSRESRSISLSVSGGTPGYSYKWTNSVGGTFGDMNSPTTTFTAPTVAAAASGTITCNVTDYCNRKNFVTKPITIYTPLPITLKIFSGKLEEDRVKLAWIVSSEINNDHYSIERSFDGINYAEIGKVNGAGNSTTEKKYTFTDYSPGDNKNYYRLKQVDFDGNYKIFDPVYVKGYSFMGRSTKVMFTPNPFTENLKLDYYTDKAGRVDISLMDHSGTIVRTETMNSDEGMNTFRFSGLTDLMPGVYYAIIIREGNKEIIKLLKY
jgi:hypothetical protein